MLSIAASDAGIATSSSEPFQQYFLSNIEPVEIMMRNLNFSHKKIIEIGVGTGELTKIILKQDIDAVVGYEIDESLSPSIMDDRFQLIYQDFLTVDDIFINGIRIENGDTNFAVVSAPPYCLLKNIAEFIQRKNILNVILMVSPKYLSLFPDYTIEIELTGDDFTPPSKGKHFIIRKGFVR